MASRAGAAGAVNSALANKGRNAHGGGSLGGSTRPNSVLQEAGQMKVSNNTILNRNPNVSSGRVNGNSVFDYAKTRNIKD